MQTYFLKKYLNFYKNRWIFEGKSNKNVQKQRFKEQ
jgi:hypothetical protein